jgi:hypothetical protein
MVVLWKQQLYIHVYIYEGSSAIKEDCFLKEVILYSIPMSYKCFILTRKKQHFQAYNAPPSGALVVSCSSKSVWPRVMKLYKNVAPQHVKLCTWYFTCQFILFCLSCYPWHLDLPLSIHPLVCSLFYSLPKRRPRDIEIVSVRPYEPRGDCVIWRAMGNSKFSLILFILFLLVCLFLSLVWLKMAKKIKWKVT